MRTAASHRRFEYFRFSDADNLADRDVNQLAGQGDKDQPPCGERDRSVVVDDGIARSRRAAVKGFLRRANSGLRLDRYREPLLGGTSSASPPHDDRYPDQRLYGRD